MDLALLSRLRSGSVLGLFPQPDVQQKSCHGQQPRRAPEIALRPVGDARCSHHCGDGSYSKHSVLLSSHHSACTAHLCAPVQPQGVHRRRIEQWGLSCWHLRNEPSICQALSLVNYIHVYNSQKFEWVCYGTNPLVTSVTNPLSDVRQIVTERTLRRGERASHTQSLYQCEIFVSHQHVSIAGDRRRIENQLHVAVLLC